MLKFDNLTAAQDLVRHANNDKDRLLVQLLTTMTDKIHQLEMQVNEFGQWRNNAATTMIRLNQLEDGLGKLHDQTVGDELAPFDERVLAVLDVRSGSARDALGLADTITDKLVLSAIEENSGEAFGHIEAEIDDKLIDFTDTCAFRDAVDEAISDGLTAKIEAALEGALHDAIIDAIGDAEDIVRKGLRSIL